jgi:hypothetical protein
LTIETIARACHEANRAICEAFGDMSQKPWAGAEQWQRDSAIAGVKFARENPSAPASAQHDAWSKDKTDNGWVFGPIKDTVAKTHPCLVPFEELSGDQKAKDGVFKAIVNALPAETSDSPELSEFFPDAIVIGIKDKMRAMGRKLQNCSEADLARFVEGLTPGRVLAGDIDDGDARYRIKLSVEKIR